MQNIKCPYCDKQTFTNWNSVIKHTSKCALNTKEFAIVEDIGPIHYTAFISSDFKSKYPTISTSRVTDFLKKFKKHKLIDKSFELGIKYSKEEIIRLLKVFYYTEGRLPTTRDWLRKNDIYPDFSTVIYHFGSWNAAIESAGFQPNLQNGFGVNTIGLDKHLYRSNAEAYFSDNFLYGKYSYIIEPKYPTPYKLYYDWYIEELDLYIELDGGCRPAIIEQKIKINNLLKRELLVLSTSTIYNKNFKLPSTNTSLC